VVSVKGQRRYRFHEGKVLIDIHLKNFNQLFNSMDPSPFIERDLDDEAVNYILSSVMEHSVGTPLKLVISIPDTELSKVDKKRHY
jgi:hypothetical protein